MSADKPTRQRIDGHAGVYRVGNRYQARYRDHLTDTVVSRTFDTLEEAEAHKALQLGFTYTVRAYRDGRFLDAFPVALAEGETAATWPERMMRQYIDSMEELSAEETRAELRRFALYLQLEQAAHEALQIMLEDAQAFAPVINGEKRMASITLKVVRGRSDELDAAVLKFIDEAIEGARR